MEAELDAPDELFDGSTRLAELRPEGEEVRRRPARVRRRPHARLRLGKAVPREDLATLVERLIAMSGQFEQRRLARPAFQLEVLDAFIGDGQMRRRETMTRAWRSSSRAPAPKTISPRPRRVGRNASPSSGSS